MVFLKNIYIYDEYFFITQVYKYIYIYKKDKKRYDILDVRDRLIKKKNQLCYIVKTLYIYYDQNSLLNYLSGKNNTNNTNGFLMR